jgi:hypothetical protein
MDLTGHQGAVETGRGPVVSAYIAPIDAGNAGIGHLSAGSEQGIACCGKQNRRLRPGQGRDPAPGGNKSNGPVEDHGTGGGKRPAFQRIARIHVDGCVVDNDGSPHGGSRSKARQAFDLPEYITGFRPVDQLHFCVGACRKRALDLKNEYSTRIPVCI